MYLKNLFCFQYFEDFRGHLIWKISTIEMLTGSFVFMGKLKFSSYKQALLKNIVGVFIHLIVLIGCIIIYAFWVSKSAARSNAYGAEQGLRRGEAPGARTSACGAE